MLLAILISPVVIATILPGDSSRIFRGIPLSYSYHTIGQELARSSPDIDVLIIGASDAWTGIDPRIISEELGKSLGRPARVVNFGTNWAGEERYAQIISDMRGKVRARLVIGLENDALQTTPHELAKYWWRGAVSTTSLEPKAQAQFYMMRILGLPRQIWSRVFMDGSREMLPSYASYVQTLSRNLGFNASASGWRSHLEPNEANRRKLPEAESAQPKLDPETFVFKGAEDAHFRYLHYTYSPLQSYFYRQVNDLVKAQGGVYVSVALPTHFRDKPLDRVMIRRLFADEPRSWPMLGIAQTALFPELTFEEMKGFYTNESHFNAVGARVFTRAIMPAIKKFYDQVPAR